MSLSGELAAKGRGHDAPNGESMCAQWSVKRGPSARPLEDDEGVTDSALRGLGGPPTTAFNVANPLSLEVVKTSGLVSSQGR